MKWIKDRFPLVVTFLIMGCAFVFSVWHYQTGQNYKSSNYSKPVSQSVIPPIHKRIKGISSKKEEREQEQKEKAFFEIADHKAQIRMADYALIGILLGIFGSYLLLCTLLYTRDAADAAKDTLEVARKTLDLSKDTAKKELRSYLMVNGFETTNALQQNKISFIVSVRNFGQTPADNVTTKMHFLFSNKDGRILNKSEGSSRSNNKIPPSNSLKIPAKIYRPNIRKNMASGEISLIFCIEITYVDIFDEAIIDVFQYDLTYIPAKEEWDFIESSRGDIRRYENSPYHG